MTSRSPSTPRPVSPRPERPRALPPGPAAGVASHPVPPAPAPGRSAIHSLARSSVRSTSVCRTWQGHPRPAPRLSARPRCTSLSLCLVLGHPGGSVFLTPFSLLLICAGHLSPSVHTGVQFTLDCAFKITLGVDRRGTSLFGDSSCPGFAKHRPSCCIVP